MPLNYLSYFLVSIPNNKTKGTFFFCLLIKHDIRHTHASILISEGVDIVKVPVRLGHANPKITYGIYAHLITNDHNDVADIFHNAVTQPR